MARLELEASDTGWRLGCPVAAGIVLAKHGFYSNAWWSHDGSQEIAAVTYSFAKMPLFGFSAWFVWRQQSINSHSRSKAWLTFLVLPILLTQFVVIEVLSLYGGGISESLFTEFTIHEILCDAARYVIDDLLVYLYPEYLSFVGFAFVLMIARVWTGVVLVDVDEKTHFEVDRISLGSMFAFWCALAATFNVYCIAARTYTTSLEHSLEIHRILQFGFYVEPVMRAVAQGIAITWLTYATRTRVLCSMGIHVAAFAVLVAVEWMDNHASNMLAPNYGSMQSLSSYDCLVAASTLAALMGVLWNFHFAGRLFICRGVKATSE